MSKKLKKKVVAEAIEKSGVPQFFHPHKEQEVEKRSEELSPILPEKLPAETQKYLEFVTSQSYKMVLEKIRRYTGRNPAELQIPQVAAAIMQALEEVVQYEAQNKERLKKLAIDTVLSLPEFEILKFYIKSGALKIEAKLGMEDVDLENAVTEMELQNVPEEGHEAELTQMERENEELARDFNEEKIRRRLAGILMQGNAVNKFYLFNMVKQELNVINPRLHDLYGIACSYIHLLYYATPDANPEDLKQAAQQGQGSCNVEAESEGYKIVAVGANFPFLIHELVKCIYNYLALNVASSEAMQSETLEQEIIEFISGPQVFLMFTKFIPQDRQYLLPLIYQEFLKLPVGEIKTILRGKEDAAPLMDRVVRRAKIDWDNYKNQIQEWENQQAGYGQEEYTPEEPEDNDRGF